jgi:hypothetical protein
VILLAAYVGFLIDGRRHQRAVRDAGLIKIVLILGLIFGSIEVLNPNSPSILVGLAGLKTYFLYAPIAFILPYAFKSKEHMFGLIRYYLIMAIPVAALGFLQIAAGPESSLNTYVSHSDEAEAIGVRFGGGFDLVRTSGTFSFISGYAVYLSFISFLAVGYNMARGWRVKNNIASILALTFVVGAMFTTGSRGPVYTLIAAGPVIVGMAVIGRVLSPQIAIRICILLPVMAVVAVNLSSRAFEGFIDRANTADSTEYRIFSPVYQTMEALSNAPALGFGIGTTHSVALSIMGTDEYWWLQGLITEDEMARVTVEIGLIGLLLIYVLRVLIAVFAFRCVISFKDPAYRALGIPLMVHLALGMLVAVITNPTASLYYWGTLGLMLAMRRLEQSVCVEVAPALRASRPKIGRSALRAE